MNYLPRLTTALLVPLFAGCPKPVTAPPIGPEPTPPTGLAFGVISPNVKVRPTDRPKLAATASMKAARNEFEPLQIVMTASQDISGVGVVIPTLVGPQSGEIPPENIVLYRVGYYEVKTPSGSTDTAGPWPDPLIPAIDPYVRETRKAFPMTIPAGQSRAVWMDLLVPHDALAGQYRGKIGITVDGRLVGELPMTLQVAPFSLPSTASLKSSYGLEFDQPCKAHTGYESCAKEWNETTANVLRARYIRAGLEHRISISDPFFQPPFDQSAGHYERHIHPYVSGRAKDLRLPGARLTSARLAVEKPEQLAGWIAYAKKRGFFSRLVYFPVDEPTDDRWLHFKRFAKQLHDADRDARIILTTTIDEAKEAGVLEAIDVFVPVINALDKTEELSKYHAWLAERPRRELWSYQSCRSHGCGDCGGSGTGPEGSGSWPTRVVDSSAVQNRAFGWLAFSLGLTGELYFDVANKLSEAWQPGGLCWSSGAGDGTLFYPGRPKLVGGKTHIPLPSIRLKLIREGMEDFEYLTLLARSDKQQALAIAKRLFPSPSRCDASAEQLEAARDELFSLLSKAHAQ